MNIAMLKTALLLSALFVPVLTWGASASGPLPPPAMEPFVPDGERPWYDDYRKAVPVVDYEALRPYIDRHTSTGVILSRKPLS